MRAKELRNYGEALGRSGMSELAMKAINDCDGSYKGVMKLAGELSQIAVMARCDDYWNEQVKRGEHELFIRLERIDLERQQ